MMLHAVTKRLMERKANESAFLERALADGRWCSFLNIGPYLSLINNGDIMLFMSGTIL